LKKQGLTSSALSHNALTIGEEDEVFGHTAYADSIKLFKWGKHFDYTNE
jgi:hypothetical protein